MTLPTEDQTEIFPGRDFVDRAETYGILLTSLDKHARYLLHAPEGHRLLKALCEDPNGLVRIIDADEIMIGKKDSKIPLTTDIAGIGMVYQEAGFIERDHYFIKITDRGKQFYEFLTGER